MRLGRIIFGVLGVAFAAGAAQVFLAGLPLPSDLALGVLGGSKLRVKVRAAGSGEELAELKAQASRVLERRFTAAGARWAEARLVGEDQIEVLAPGLAGNGVAKDLLAPGRLGIRLVVADESLDAGEKQAEIKRLMAARREGAAGAPDEPYEIALRRSTPPNVLSLGRNTDPLDPGDYVLLERGELNSEDLASASLAPGGDGLPGVSFVMTDRGADRLQALTSGAIDRQLAVVIDGRVLQIAVLRSALQSEGLLSGSFTDEELSVIAGLMGGGALRSELELVSETPVSESPLAAYLPWMESGLPWLLAILALLCLVLAALSRKREPAG